MGRWKSQCSVSCPFFKNHKQSSLIRWNIRHFADFVLCRRAVTLSKTRTLNCLNFAALKRRRQEYELTNSAAWAALRVLNESPDAEFSWNFQTTSRNENLVLRASTRWGLSPLASLRLAQIVGSSARFWQQPAARTAAPVHQQPAPLLKQEVSQPVGTKAGPLGA